MKKLFLLCGIIFPTAFSFAQTQGDITSSNIYNTNHDLDNCISLGDLGFAIVIENSFLNDSVKVVDPSNGQVLFSEGNLTGQTPWNIITPQNLNGFLPDQYLVNNMGSMFFQPVKIISGPDTLWPNTNMFVNVPNPCIYKNVSGKIYVDANEDCSFNSGDTPLSAVSVISNSDVTNTQSSYTLGSSGFSDVNGAYTISVQETWMTGYTVDLPTPYQFIFPLSSCSQAPYSFSTLPQTNVDFAVQCADIDVSANAYHSGAVRPNVPFFLYPRVQNEGCDPAAGVLKLILDPNVTYNPSLSTNPANSVSGDTLFWNYNNLSNLSNGAYWNSFISGLHLTPDASVNIGDVLCFQLSTGVLTNDIDPANNISTVCLPVVNSYDPNIKESSPKGDGPQGYIATNTDELTYTIHFQNTGNAAAINVSVVDSLPLPVEPSSLRILASSHYMFPNWDAEGVIRFTFQSINLPDSTTNEAASHGFVTFKINLDNGLTDGTQIKNKAHIYFDFNPAIITNTALNTLADDAGMNDNNIQPVNVYPNPSDGLYTLNLNGASTENLSITVFDITGQPVYKLNNTNGSQQIDITHLPAGLYILSVDGGTSFKQRIIKR